MSCVICNHPERDNIDSAFLINTPIEVIAEHYNLPIEDLSKHQAKCANFTMSMDEFDAMVKKEVSLSSSPSEAHNLTHPESLQRQINLREADYLTAVLQEYMITLKSTGREIQRSIKMAHDMQMPLKHALGQSIVDLYLGTGGEVRQTIKTLSDIGKQIRDAELGDSLGVAGVPQVVIMGRPA